MTISYDNIHLIYEDEKNISILSIVQKGLIWVWLKIINHIIIEIFIKTFYQIMWMIYYYQVDYFVIVLHITILKDFSGNQFKKLKAQTIRWLPRFILYAYNS